MEETMDPNQPSGTQDLRSFIQSTPSELSGFDGLPSVSEPSQRGAEGIVTADGVVPVDAGTVQPGQSANATGEPEAPINLAALLAGQVDGAQDDDGSSEVEELRRQNAILAQERAAAMIARADAAFEIAVRQKVESGEWTEVQAVTARANRREAILTERNRQLQEAQEQNERASHEDRQAFFKRLTAIEVAQNAGLSPDLVPLLNDATIRNRAQMEARARGLAAWVAQNRPATTPAPTQPQNTAAGAGLNLSAIVGGGDNGNPIASAQAKPYSGDLSTLIKNTPHEVVSGW